ncbi:MAG: hypothetical protein K1X78_14935 [Verrucomicrobiaceae bacterium]|nr:hypothetical protein [Verrucomicrobiaceae bacterium]
MRQLSGCAISIKAFVQSVGHLIEFELKRHTMQKEKVVVAKTIYLRVQKRAEFLGIDGRC